ncbi:30S ribosomal protein S13 [bacterium HR19]|nr:30S ribosomal protein S13 [bacterium HR19]
MRILGRDILDRKKIIPGLSDIFGIGNHTAFEIASLAGIDYQKRIKDLTEEDIAKINSVVERLGIKLEGDLRREISENIQRLKDIKCYRGLRHIAGLPVRGQRTHSNARTRKGPRKHKILARKKKKK